jgi:hypothetical protein
MAAVVLSPLLMWVVVSKLPPRHPPGPDTSPTATAGALRDDGASAQPVDRGAVPSIASSAPSAPSTSGPPAIVVPSSVPSDAGARTPSGAPPVHSIAPPRERSATLRPAATAAPVVADASAPDPPPQPRPTGNGDPLLNE